MIRNPFEVIKQNQQLGKFHTIYEAASEIVSKRGIKGFYAGYFSLIMREIPFSGLQFPLYEFFKKFQISQLAKLNNVSESDVNMTFKNHALNGASAGSIAGFLVTPIDVIKTRQMTQDINNSNLNATAIIKEIMKEEGIKGMFRGAGMRLVYLYFGG